MGVQGGNQSVRLEGTAARSRRALISRPWVVEPTVGAVA